MKQRILLFMTLLAMVVSTARAQSKIDDLVDHFSTSTTSKYTSAVERNPKTREVVKVVKILEMNYCDATPFVNAFKKDTSNGELSETRSGNDLVMTRTMQGKKQNRIYMLKADGYYNKYGLTKTRSHCTITVIIKYK